MSGADHPERVEEFVDLYLADVDHERVRPIEEYVALFPDIGDQVRAEFLVLERGREGKASQNAPSRLGPYILGDRLGAGRQGVVYQAIHAQTRGRVALKVLRSLGPANEGGLLRFRREATAAAKLDHPGLCPIYDADVADGVPYIAMKFIEGESLAARIAVSRRERAGNPVEESDGGWTVRFDPSRNPSSTASTSAGSTQRRARSTLMQVIEFVERAARAIHVAHEAGIVHRDLKPGNLMVTSENSPVVLDFGLAWDADSDVPGITQTGDLLGTPAYMSPEQLTRQSIRLDRRTDVWSLGVTLYECVTLRRPFDGPTVESLYQQVLTRPAPNPRRIDRSLPKDLVTVLETALEKDRDRRYGTALDFAEDLRRIRQYEPIRARPASVRTRVLRWVQREPAVGALILVLVLAAATSTASALRASRAARDAETANATAQAQAQRAASRALEGRQLARALLYEIEPEIRRVRGATRARTVVGERGLAFLDGLNRESGDDPELLRELAGGYVVIGGVHGGADNGNLGDATIALRSYDQAIGIYRRLGCEDFRAPDDLLLEAAIAHERRGDVLGNPFATNLGDTVAARQSLDEAARTLDELIRREPGSLDLRLRRAHLLSRLGDTFIPYAYEIEAHYLQRWRATSDRKLRSVPGAMMQAGSALLSVTRARALYQKATDMANTVAREANVARDLWIQVQFVVRLRATAAALLMLPPEGPDQDGATQLLANAKQVMDLAIEARDVPELRFLSSRAELYAFGVLARVHFQIGNVAEAASVARQGAALTREAYSGAAMNVEAVRDLALAEGGTATVFRCAGLAREADDCFRRVVPLCARLVEEDRTTHDGFGIYSPIEFLLPAAFGAIDVGDIGRAIEYLGLAHQIESKVARRTGVVLFEIDRLRFLLRVAAGDVPPTAEGDDLAESATELTNGISRAILDVARGVARLGSADAAGLVPLLARVADLDPAHLDPEERTVAALACDAMTRLAAGEEEAGRWATRARSFRAP